MTTIRFLIWMLLPAAAFAHGPGKEGTFGGKRVLFIGIDGCRADAVTAAIERGMAPQLKALSEDSNGLLSLKCYAGGELGKETHQPTVSGPGWTSLLTGVWMSAPYLHNGSVPTMRQLLTPEERPARFMVGGHRLDFRTLGIAGAVDADGVYAYPRSYAPWSKPVVIDTRAPGLSNRGHEADVVGLSESEKTALIEYLKLL